jgi:hypothetical protein
MGYRRIMAEIRGRVMTVPHYCYDEGDDLPQFLIGKIAGNGNRTRMSIGLIRLVDRQNSPKIPLKKGRSEHQVRTSPPKFALVYVQKNTDRTRVFCP